MTQYNSQFPRKNPAVVTSLPWMAQQLIQTAVQMYDALQYCLSSMNPMRHREQTPSRFNELLSGVSIFLFLAAAGSAADPGFQAVGPSAQTVPDPVPKPIVLSDGCAIKDSRTNDPGSNAFRGGVTSTRTFLPARESRVPPDPVRAGRCGSILPRCRCRRRARQPLVLEQLLISLRGTR